MFKETLHNICVIILCLVLVYYWSKLNSEIAQTLVLGMLLAITLFLINRSEWKKKK